ncbi:MAG: SdiA-regulated family protein, partial [Pedobacter sp.]
MRNITINISQLPNRYFVLVVFALVISLTSWSCAEKKAVAAQNPKGYDLENPKRYSMPDILQEISGIAFNKGDNSVVYAQQDEDGILFSLPLGTKDDKATKFGKKGDYEDIAVAQGWAILLKSNGTFYSFPLTETSKEEVENVKETKDLIPKGEYEGMFANETTGDVYVLCKNCKVDKDTKKTSGYVLSLQTDGSLKSKGTFQIDVSNLDKMSGKKKGTFHPSALAINPITKQWFIVSSVNKVLLIADEKFNVISTHHLSSNTFNQPEGIAFDKDGNLFISNEGSETQTGNILRFDYK